MTPDIGEKEKLYCVGIGASAGGHEALVEFFSHLPPETGAAYFVSAPLPRFYKARLIDIIERHTQMTVTEIDRPVEISPSHVYIQGDNTLMTFHDAATVAPKRVVAEMLNRTIDTFLLSLAECFKERAIGVILSGAGDDGATGAMDIHSRDGRILVQSPASSLFKAMPYAAIRRIISNYRHTGGTGGKSCGTGALMASGRSGRPRADTTDNLPIFPVR